MSKVKRIDGCHPFLCTVHDAARCCSDAALFNKRDILAFGQQVSDCNCLTVREAVFINTIEAQ